MSEKVATQSGRTPTEGAHPQATHTGEVQIGGVALPCYVLENEMRVISQNGMLAALGMSRGEGGERLARFASQKRFKPFIGRDLSEGIGNPPTVHSSTGRGPFLRIRSNDSCGSMRGDSGG